eukprot:5269615-Heterocapsa_arctica.AAC.1
MSARVIRPRQDFTEPAVRCALALPSSIPIPCPWKASWKPITCRPAGLRLLRRCCCPCLSTQAGRS